MSQRPAAEGATPAPAPQRSGLSALREAACRLRAGELRPEDLPMIAAEAVAAGIDTPGLCDLAGWPRTADPRDTRDAFEHALSEAAVTPPAQGLARRHALRRMAARLVSENVSPAELAIYDWGDVQTDTAEEDALVALFPSCGCCIRYSVGIDVRRWEVEVRQAALALTLSTSTGPGC